MKAFKTTISSIAQDKFLRIDEKFFSFLSLTTWSLFAENVPSCGNLIPLRDIICEDYHLCSYMDYEEYKGVPTGQQYIDIDGDIISYDIVSEGNHPARLKYTVFPNNIVLSSLRLAKSPAFMFNVDDYDQYVFSNGFYIFRVIDETKWNTKFICYILRHNELKKILDNNLYRGIGISSYKVNDLLNILIPSVSISKQEKALKMITPFENSITDLKSKRRTQSEIIDEVFEREFSFDYKKFEILKNKKIHFVQACAFSNNPDLRFSTKFHRLAGEFVLSELKHVTDRKIKHYIAEPITLGASISPKDFDENGTAYYISMATIKTLKVELDDTQLVSDSYFEAKSNKSVMPNDIIIARSGVAIGKSAIVEKSFEGVFSDFTMRLRFDETKCNPHFAYYYIRSKYFQYLIEIYKKGLQNQNIFPIVIQEFPFPNISLTEQNIIVDMIKTEMEKQNVIKAKIAELRNNIDCIIESAITA